ncbi:protein FAM200C-like [Phlebotomus papatasi]|uniref:protein FAM200C-like n=1 Tax=Phlebotomus papatasi TaxID=29031 RepID=UPI002483FD57|nr:protein FAM200C-like [Phlebotomus papatasi]
MFDLKQLITTTGRDILTAIQEALTTVGGEGVLEQKLAAITTDGAPAMTGSIKGFWGRMANNMPHVKFYHCIIHEQVLCVKAALSLHDTVNKVVKIINRLRSGKYAQTHRQLREFLKDVGAQFPDLKMFTEVRWLSKGQALYRFFKLRREVPLFMERIPGFNHDVFHHIKRLDQFTEKLQSMSQELLNNNIHQFPCCKELSSGDFTRFASEIQNLHEEFQTRFKKYDEIRNVAAKYPDFPELVPEDNSEDSEMLRRYLCTFPTTYRCEQGFSILGQIKTKHRGNLSHRRLKFQLLIALTPSDERLYKTNGNSEHSEEELQHAESLSGEHHNQEDDQEEVEWLDPELQSFMDYQEEEPPNLIDCRPPKKKSKKYLHMQEE